MEASFEFPSAKTNDASDVATALETAQALWRRGDSREALRWLRRAAEGAENEGDDLRAVALARAAADLQDQLPATSSASAPAPSQPPPLSKQPPPLTQQSATATPAPVRSAPPPPSQRTIAAAGGLEPWTPPASRPSTAPERSSPRTSRPPPLPQQELPSAPSRPPPLPASSEAAPAPTPAPAAAQAPAPAAVQASAPESPKSAEAPKARTAVRVSVEVLSKKSGTLLVRLLGEDDSPNTNAHEALLVPLAPGVDLRNL